LIDFDNASYLFLVTIRAMLIGIVLIIFFGTGSINITIIAKLQMSLAAFCRVLRSRQAMKHPSSLKPRRNRIKIRNMGGAHTFNKTFM